MKLILTLTLAAIAVVAPGCSSSPKKMQVNRPTDTILLEGGY